MEYLNLRFTADDCMGCHACEIACKQEHRLNVGPRLVKIIEHTDHFVPVYCRHCGNPPCRRACPVEAIVRDEKGLVLIIDDLCIGCRDCVDACPFGAMQFDERDGLARKCDLCESRVTAGLQPACVVVCATRCIHLIRTLNVESEFDQR